MKLAVRLLVVIIRLKLVVAKINIWIKLARAQYLNILLIIKTVYFLLYLESFKLHDVVSDSSRFISKNMGNLTQFFI